MDLLSKRYCIVQKNGDEQNFFFAKSMADVILKMNCVRIKALVGALSLLCEAVNLHDYY